MVYRAGQTCLIQFYLSDGAQNETLTPDRYQLCESTCGKDLYDFIEKHPRIQANRFKLYLSTEEKKIDLSKMKDKTMVELGVDLSFDQDSTEYKYKVLVDVGPDVEFQNEFVDGPSKCNPAPASHLSSIWEEDNNVDFKNYIKSKTCYVGLVNQAMTCYLNSLLQALYMTPEFRNALYNWEYVNGSETDEANSIPYQLQKLFLNLQTSSRSAVETTPLTKSFGWDSTEAWQQHDIQELCRVMFDALEQKFKNTEQADLINRHYEGMMIDYVKCLECGTEKSREDTFLDIPLPVRPFGSNVAYNSVEEALKAFVQYETLEGSNQYYCEKCNKKCNAHKGLKFTKFPYLVTLHLKRFDFDFKTYHRVKLNDKVTFPDILNLNPFISSTSDDGSTTDSGTLDDDYPSCESSLPNSNHLRNHDQDGDDEGIHISNCPSTSNCTVHNHENEKNHSNNEAKGPYNYELFSIMIHSGSASGGHYYAYIKDFKTQEWLCFNDQSVTQITHDDIQKTYGGGPTRPYYSGACSSTNAYMLMYRQIDPVRNALPMQVQDFPKHIQELLKKMKENEDNEKICQVSKVCDFNYESAGPRKNDRGLLNMENFIVSKSEMLPPIDFQACIPMCNVVVYCKHPFEGKKRSVELIITFGQTLEQVTKLCYEYFELTKIIAFNRCRLVLYDHNNDTIITSYEGREHETDIYQIGTSYYLLEIRKLDEEFQPYPKTDLSTTVYIIDIPRKRFIDGPIDVHGTRSQTVKEYKQMVAKAFGRDLCDMKVFLQKCGSDEVVEVDDDLELQTAGFTHLMNVYISNVPDTECKTFHHSTICELIENTVLLRLKLPELSKEILEEWNIPLLDEKYKDKEKPIVNSPSKVSVNDSHRDVSPKRNEVPKSEKSNEDAPVRNASPQLGESEEWNTPEQSNSEDSSLSDSDKTLVGDAPEDDYFHVENVSFNTNNRFKQIKLEHRDNVVDDKAYYFEATPYTAYNQKFLQVQVDKRMPLIALKNALEPYVGVPTEYFRICHPVYERYELCIIKEKLAVCEEDQECCIKLTRPLRSDEFTVIAYQLDINSHEPYKLLGEVILSTDMTFGQAKKEILALIKRKHNIDIPFDRCRLREKFASLVTTLYLDHQKLEDFRSVLPSEIAVQELPDKEPVTSSDQHVVFVRKWSPTSMQLGPLEEIIMDRNSVMEMKAKLSAISDIPEKYIGITSIRSYSLNVLPIIQVKNIQEWSVHSDSEFDLDDGSMVLYRDNREVVKNLAREALNNIAIKEVSHILPRSSRRSRKEKGLRIHLSTE